MELSKTLEPLAPLRAKINVVNGLFNKQATGVGIHPGQTGNILSCAAVQKGADATGGISVVTAADLYDAPEQVLARVRDALVVRGATGSRRHFKTEWLRYFTALNVVTAVMRDARSSTSGTDRLTAVMRTISDPGDG